MAARDGQRARTRRDLVRAGLDLLRQGQTPTVAEVAEAAGVSRRTAYRYFAGADHLIVDALLEDMRSGVEGEIDAGATEGEDVGTRVDRLVDALHHLTVDKEQLLRQMIRFTLDRGPIEPGVPPRPSRRLEYVDQALSPLQATLAPAAYQRLVHATAVVIGIEARIVLRDICGLDDEAIVDTERWAAHALLEAAQREAAAETRPVRRSRKRGPA